MRSARRQSIAPLTRAVEDQFRDSIVHAFGNPAPDQQPIRKRRTTTFERNEYTGGRQRFSLTENGALGFVSLACVHTSDGLLLFLPSEFLYHLALACLLACASMFTEWADIAAAARLVAPQ